ncbi:type I phosphomannose isomerase catalytic subunit [Spiroplasma culicicola]|uniref:Mannose-6-phosphate isomerase n=1 Tax=Spiroplasma culicicola AES-1 TaxID=1276246 RepID=W6A672_9MOLU|nr:type I phosphomannose isomerase catalytic subunit [Spiroplasma culicicola]AHI52446.1 mannose-6-phosphate isomerase [Spiroplasma culicicola AES-1]
MSNVFKIEPHFSERIWGGTKLKEFGFDIPSDNIGEAWVISAHPNGMGYLNVDNKRISLKEFFETNEVFKNSGTEFPLLSKIITANDYLSVQVHPDDKYALQHHNSLGKPESWYILDCPSDAKLIYGHHAKTIEEFKDAIENNILDVLEYVEIAPGDFIYVEPGKIHAITPGVTLFELQRSSDITYRLFDYNRLEKNGEPRELHIDHSLANIKIPDSEGLIIRSAKAMIFESQYFNLFLHDSEHKFEIKNQKWIQFTVIDKNCIVNGMEFKTGESGIAIIDNNFQISGQGKTLISWV